MGCGSFTVVEIGLFGARRRGSRPPFLAGRAGPASISSRIEILQGFGAAAGPAKHRFSSRRDAEKARFPAAGTRFWPISSTNPAVCLRKGVQMEFYRKRFSDSRTLRLAHVVLRGQAAQDGPGKTAEPAWGQCHQTLSSGHQKSTDCHQGMVLCLKNKKQSIAMLCPLESGRKIPSLLSY